MASERNPFPQDLEDRERTSPRRSWFSLDNIVLISTALIGAISFALFLYIVFVHAPFGSSTDFGDWNSTEPWSTVSTKVPETIPTVVPTTVSSTIPTTDPKTASTTETTMAPTMASTTTSTTTPNTTPTMVSTTVPTTVPTMVPTTVPTMAPTTVPTTVPATVPMLLETGLSTVTTTTLAPPPSTTVIPPRSGPVNFHDSGSYVADDDEYDRPWLMGRAPWNMCVPRFQTVLDFTDMTWMCSKCHQDIRDGTYEVEFFIELHFEYLCFKMCFITPEFEGCAVHLNRTQPKPSPVSARDCRFCNEQERHRKKPRLN